MLRGKKMDIKSYGIPKKGLFRLPVLGKNDCSSKPHALQNHGETCSESWASSCEKSEDMEYTSDISEDEQREAEFCWCRECNAEFLTREELRHHSKKHGRNATMDKFSQDDDFSSSNEEYKLMSGEVRLLKSGLCCGKCQEEFENEKRLVKHIEKYDFRCEPRSFINLNNCLNNLRSKRAENKGCSSNSVVARKSDANSNDSVTGCTKKNDLIECVNGMMSEGKDQEIEYCWCTGCNKEFLSRKELMIHSEKHRNEADLSNHNQKNDSLTSSEEYKMISGETSVLKSEFSCAMCEREFENEKGLVKHVEKYDFKCEPRRFINLISFLKNLKSKRAEDNALCNSNLKDATFEIKSKLHVSELQHPGDSIDVKSEMDDRLMESDSNSSLFVEIPNRRGRATVGSLGMKVKNSNLFNICSSNVDSVLEMEAFRYLDVPDKMDQSEGVSGVIKSGGKHNNGDAEVVICDYCTKPHDLKSELREHIILCHLSVETHKCSICYSIFPTENEFKIHHAKHLSKKKYICNVCYDNFSSRAKVVAHLSFSHKMRNGFLCSGCFLCFPSRPELCLHQVYHASEKGYKCSKCGKAFIGARYFKKHVRFCQLGVVLQECKICCRQFYNLSNYKHHVITHDSFKRYSCHLCPKKFSQYPNLCSHIKFVHLKIKPHECGICQKRFSLRRYLFNHYAIHSDDRPFKCEQCGKLFKRKQDVLRHKRRMHARG